MSIETHGAPVVTREPIDVAAELAALVDDGARMLRSLDAPATRQGERWSARQVLGHLIDSAANNHARFVRGQLEEDLVFDGYDQDGWVEAQGYDEASWDELVSLWQAYNRHLVRVIERIDPLEWSRPRARHNFDRIGFAPIEASRLGSLGWLVVDYVGHLRHHLSQIEGLAAR